MLTLREQRSGPGIWRCNPKLVQDDKFQKELSAFCDPSALYNPMMDVLSQWDRFKVVLKGFIQNFSHKSHAKTRRQQAYLHRQRTQILQHQHDENTNAALGHVEYQLDRIAE